MHFEGLCSFKVYHSLEGHNPYDMLETTWGRQGIPTSKLLQAETAMQALRSTCWKKHVHHHRRLTTLESEDRAERCSQRDCQRRRRNGGDRVKSEREWRWLWKSEERQSRNVFLRMSIAFWIRQKHQELHRLISTSHKHSVKQKANRARDNTHFLRLQQMNIAQEILKSTRKILKWKTEQCAIKQRRIMNLFNRNTENQQRIPAEPQENKKPIICKSLIRGSKEEHQKFAHSKTFKTIPAEAHQKKILLIRANAIQRFKNQSSKICPRLTFFDMTFACKPACRKNLAFAKTLKSDFWSAELHLHQSRGIFFLTFRTFRSSNFRRRQFFEDLLCFLLSKTCKWMFFCFFKFPRFFDFARLARLCWKGSWFFVVLLHIVLFFISACFFGMLSWNLLCYFHLLRHGSSGRCSHCWFV